VVIGPEDGQAFKWSAIILDADFFELVGLACMTDAHTASFPGFFGFPEGIEAAPPFVAGSWWSSAEGTPRGGVIAEEGT